MKLIGHRGGKDEWPENTLMGFSNAIDVGVQGLELDVHKSRDGRLMVIHDPTLDRTTNGSGRVRDLDSSQIREFDAGLGERVPYLEEALELAIERDCHVFIESKDEGIENDLVATIRDLSAVKKCTVICFNHFFVKEIKALAPEISTGCLLVGAPVDAVGMIKSAKADLLASNINTLAPEMVRQCKASSIPIAVWNANSVAEFQHVVDLGVNFVMTDRPTEIATFIKSK